MIDHLGKLFFLRIGIAQQRRRQRGERIASSDCYNVFERVAFSRFTGLQEYRRRFHSAGAEEIHLAGSGPTLFTIVQDEAQGLEICRQLEKERIEVYLVKTL